MTSSSYSAADRLAALVAAASRSPGCFACAEGSDAPALSSDALDEGWRQFRHRLVTTAGEPESDGAEDAAEASDAWVHRIEHPERACILVPKENVVFESDQLLSRSVLLVLEHSAELGTVAVALNRPTENQLGDVLKRSGVTAEELAEGPRELHEAFGLRPLNLGGTESGDADSGKQNVFMLALSEGESPEEHAAFAGEGAEALLPGLWLASAPDAAKRVNAGLAPPERFHVFAGAYVWEAGELEAEFDAGAWHAASASTATIEAFLLGDEAEPEAKYQAALRWAEGEGGEGGEGGAPDAPPPIFAGTVPKHDPPPTLLSSSARKPKSSLSSRIKGGGASKRSSDVLGAAHTWVQLFDEEETAAGPRLTGPPLAALLGAAHSWLAGGSKAREGSRDEFREPWEAQLEPHLGVLADRARAIMSAPNAPGGGGASAAGSAAAAGTLVPRLALQAIGEVLLSHARAAVIPDEQPAVELEKLSLANRLGELAARLMPPAATAAAAHSPLGGCHPEAEAAAEEAEEAGRPVEVSSLQLGLAALLLAERLGLTASLVDIDGCGLLLRVDMATGDVDMDAPVAEDEEPVYVSLAPGESCFRTLSRRDCMAPPEIQLVIGDGLAASAEAATAERTLDPLSVASLLVEEWSEAFHVASDSKRAKFWDVQRHLLCRLAERLADARGEPNPMAGRGGRGEPTTTRLGGDLKGLVIRTNLQREDSDVYDA